MNKKLLALAVAAVVSAPALADDSTVTLYGTLNVDFENVKAEGCTTIAPATSCVDLKQRNRVSSNSSNIGFRGVEPLMPGLDAWFQVESSVGIDTGAASGTWASRNSGVGLKGNFGSVVLGQWDSPYKVSTGRLDVFGNTTIGAYTAIMGGNGSFTAANGGATTATRASFDRRVSNTVQYWTPNLGGFSGRFAYGANEEKSSPPASGLNPSLFSVSGSYDNGPLYLTLAYEEHKDFGTLVAVTTTGQGKDQGWKTGGSYDFANLVKVGLIYEELKYKSDVAGAALTERKVKNGFATVTFHPGPHAISLNYGKRFDVDDTPTTAGNTGDLEAQFWAVRYAYSFSKRTELWVAYSKVDNERAAQQDFGNNGISPSLGADPEGLGVGFIHRF